MSSSNRLNRAFKNAIELPLSASTKYVLMSDCHRGIGSANDNFLKNQHLCYAALKHYYQNHFTYIELGDGDELWENRNLETIINIHSNIYCLFAKFYRENRFYMIYGNHDIIKKRQDYVNQKYKIVYCEDTGKKEPLFPKITCHEAMILRSVNEPEKALYLTHGHQASLLNSTFWPVAQFLIRYLWRPLEGIGFSNPTSAAKNNRVRTDTEKKLNTWATKEKHILIAGHTHRPLLTTESPYYCNTGSCIHPNCITCIEVERTTLTLVKWCTNIRTDGTLYVAREVLSKPVSI